MFALGALFGAAVMLALVLLVAKYFPKALAKLVKESGEELDEFEKRVGGN